MNKPKSFLETFFEQYPEAKSGKLSIDEINKLLFHYQKQQNNKAIDDFDGLSPIQMNDLLYHPLSEKSILQLREADENVLKQVPLFQLAESLLRLINAADRLKLTAKGNLTIDACAFLTKQNLIRWRYQEYTKRISEDAVPFIGILKFYLLQDGLVKKQHNHLLLTKKGIIHLNKPILFRFKELLSFYTSSLSWSSLYAPGSNERCGQFGWAFSMVLLAKYGHVARNADFYSEYVYRAFGSNYASKGEHNALYSVRFFEYFLDWFGLIKLERIKGLSVDYYDKFIVTKTDLFDSLFEVKK